MLVLKFSFRSRRCLYIFDVQIWSLDGRVVQVLDRALSNPMTVDPSGPEPKVRAGERHRVCVRDVSWHSQVWISTSTYICSLTERILSTGTHHHERWVGKRERRKYRSKA